MDVKQTCCFSGHRPNKLIFGYDEAHKACAALKVRLALEIGEMHKKGVTTFITGMAQGVDIWCSEIVLELKRAHPEKQVRLAAIIPYKEQADRWPLDMYQRYFNILAAADEVRILHKEYTHSCMYERNRAMVDASAHLIAVFNGAPGGTKYTMDYARKKGLDIVAINPDEFINMIYPFGLAE